MFSKGHLSMMAYHFWFLVRVHTNVIIIHSSQQDHREWFKMNLQDMTQHKTGQAE